MNKTILIAGGASVASLAVGAAGGYFVAKRRFDKQVREEVTREVNATKKYYSVLLMQAKEQKPDFPEDLPVNENEEELEDLEESEEGELSEADQRSIEKGRQKLLTRDATSALVDYQGISTRQATQSPSPVATLVHNNIFDNADPTTEKPKKTRPPRDDTTGRYRKKTPREEEHDPPQIVTAEAFLLNDIGYNQESLLYFVNDKTLVLEADPSEPIDINLIGEVNLTLFPDVPEDMISMIYVENGGMSTSYEIKRMTESLTDYIGLGENGGEELDDSEYL